MNPQTNNPPELTRSTNVHFTSAEKKLMETAASLIHNKTDTDALNILLKHTVCVFNSRLKAVETIQKAYRKFQTQILEEILKLQSINKATKCYFCTTKPEPYDTWSPIEVLQFLKNNMCRPCQKRVFKY